MKLWIRPNAYNQEQAEQVLACIASLETNGGHQCALSPSDSVLLYGSDAHSAFTPEESDMIISLGGDGSVLRAAKTAIAVQKPLLGINSGRLGYLCAIQLSEVDRFNEKLETLSLTNRTLLEFCYQGSIHRALNDVVIAKLNFGETADLQVCVDGEEPRQIRGDGLILATPTGSTAYNLSSGGSILDPGLPAIAVTPICPHIARHPMVISDSRSITVSERNNHAQIFADGVLTGTLEEPVTVYRSPRPLQLYSAGSDLRRLLELSD